MCAYRQAWMIVVENYCACLRLHNLITKITLTNYYQWTSEHVHFRSETQAIKLCAVFERQLCWCWFFKSLLLLVVFRLELWHWGLRIISRCLWEFLYRPISIQILVRSSCFSIYFVSVIGLRLKKKVFSFLIVAPQYQ